MLEGKAGGSGQRRGEGFAAAPGVSNRTRTTLAIPHEVDISVKPTARRLFSASLSLTLLLALAACGGGGSEDSPAQSGKVAAPAGSTQIDKAAENDQDGAAAGADDAAEDSDASTSTSTSESGEAQEDVEEEAGLTPADAVGGLEPGDYVCDYRPSLNAVPQQKGTIEMAKFGLYRYLENGEAGTYEFDPASNSITWRTGPLADKQPTHTDYQLNERTSQIDILFEGDVWWSCGHNL